MKCLNWKKVDKSMTNTLKLRSLILEKGMTQDQVAKMLGISYQSFNRKVNNHCEFKASEIKALTNILDIKDVNDIFFAHNVDL